MSSFDIQITDITSLDTDAIVNAANESLKADGSVSNAIFDAAGREELQAACDKIGHCDTGYAVITPGFQHLDRVHQNPSQAPGSQPGAICLSKHY